MFSGNYTATVDNYGRFTFPAKQLSQIGKDRKMYVILGVLGSSLWIMTKAYWDEFSAYIVQKEFPFGVKEMALRRQFLGNAFDTEIEANSRIGIPQTLLDKVGIVDKCMIVGVGDFFELWDPTKYAAREREEETIRDKAVRELGGTIKL